MLRLRSDGAVDLDVHAVPKSSRDAIGKPHGGRLKVHVRAAPVDGKANEALVAVLARALGLRRDALSVASGHTGKRKTVRILGLGLAEVAAALGLPDPVSSNSNSSSSSNSSPVVAPVLAAALGLAACESPRELPIKVILPADTSDYARADNASVVLRPSGDSYNFSVDGLDFALELEGEPTTTTQQLELYLAEGDDLIAWGASVPFATAGPDIGLALFLGRPGLLSSWPDRLDTPDPELLGAEALARGLLLVEADGDTYLLNQYTLELEVGRRLPDTVSFAATDGGLFSAADGGVLRLAYEELEPVAWRYDATDDTWTELSVDGAADIGLRPGAAALVDPDRTRLYLLGGGGTTNAVAIDLIPSAAGVLAAAPVAGFELDGPRDHATALWVPDGDNPSADVLVVGGDSPGPVAVLASAGVGIGPERSWTGAGCAVLNPETRAILCVGGLADGAATADAILVEVADTTATVDLRESFLPAPLAAPMVLSDDFALYAQGDQRWFRIARTDTSVTEPESAPLRASGGDFVRLAKGVTFVVGGVDPEGVALDRWQVFTPAVGP